MPLWRPGEDRNAVGLAVTPDGMLVLASNHSTRPVLALAVKETTPRGTALARVYEDLYVRLRWTLEQRCQA